MADPIVVVGAGIGGMSAAIRLAVAGKQVVVLEKNGAPGGKMSEIAEQGFRWDTGPSVITMRPVFQSLFALAGRRFEDYVHLVAVDPLTRYFFADGSTIDAVADHERMAEQIAAIEPRDVDGYRDFLEYARKIYEITSPVFIEGDPPSLGSFRKAGPLDLFRIDALRTLHQAVSKRVRSPQMRMLLDRFATYVGASPYSAPATLASIAHIELQDGVWYPQGGIYQIAHAYWRLALELGVEIRTDSAVRAIAVEKGRAMGVVLEDGALQPAQAVLSNLDVTQTYRTLLPRTRAIEQRLLRLQHTETSCSGFVMLLGVEGDNSELAHHNLYFPEDYRAEFRDIFGKGVPPEDPAIYLAITSRSDPSHAPEGCENWFVLVNTPASSAGFDWRLNAQEYGDHILDRLAARGLDVRSRLRVRKHLTPVDLERMSGAWQGALYGISSNRAINAFRRPHNRCPDVERLYFAGGTTHPGGGVPMVTLSGAVAARLIQQDLLNT